MNPAVAADSIEKDFTFKRARLGCESRDPTFESKSQIIGRYRNPVLFKSSIRFNCSALHCRSSPRGGMLSDCVRASIRSCSCRWSPDDWGSSSATPSITCGRKTESPRRSWAKGHGRLPFVALTARFSCPSRRAWGLNSLGLFPSPHAFRRGNTKT